MKKIYSFLLTVGLLCSFPFIGGAQIIITGVMADPTGVDAHATDVANPGYEYVQLRATQYIDFGVTPYAVVCLYETTTTPLPNNGWASGSQGLTYQFNLTSGTVNKGEFFYVGGAAKLINGAGSLDISSAKWIRSFDYAKQVDDAGVAVGKTTLLGNSNRANAVAVFVGVTVAEATKPLDVVFYGATGTNHYSAGPPERGFRITTNDKYNTANGDFFNKGTNNSTVVTTAAAYASAFLKFGGEYNTETNTWITPRSATIVAEEDLTSIAAIESGTGTTTVPVKLTSYNGKFEENKVQLNWTTASEKNNSHFNILRSPDGKNATLIGTVSGKGDSNATENYSFTDENYLNGDNYYHLVQYDFDGKTSDEKIIVVNTALTQSSINAFAMENTVNISLYVKQGGKGKINITDVSGRSRITVPVNAETGYQRIEIPVTLEKGIYIATYTSGVSEKLQVKFIQ